LIACLFQKILASGIERAEFIDFLNAHAAVGFSLPIELPLV